jgi:hypothetical protein
MSDDDARRRYGGRLRVAVGALVCGLCGSCTAFYAGYSILAFLGLAPDEFGASVIVLPTSLVIGGLPTLVGVFLMRSGLRRLRPAPPP